MAISAAIMGALGASSRSWNLAYTETFTAAPSAGTDYSTRSGSPSISWDSANQALSISNETTQGFISWDKWGGFTGQVAFEMDMVFASDSAARKHFGMFCDSAASGVNGYRLSTLDGASFNLSRWVGSSETSLGVFTTSFNPVIGTTYTFRLERNSSGVFSLYINGVLQPNTITNTQYATIRPGFFVYGCAIRINELRVYN